MDMPIHNNRDEQQRLDALRSFMILDTQPEALYDDAAILAAQICDVPIAAISLIDENRQWIKSSVGSDVRETSRDVAFCSHTILGSDVLLVNDATQDPRFSEYPLVTGDPGIRFYVGAPLITSDGYALGALCVLDQKPRQLSAQQIEALRALSRQITSHIETRRLIIREREHRERHEATCKEMEKINEQLEATNAQLESVNESLKQTIACRQIVEAELVRMAAQTEQVLASISSILIGVDSNGRITLWNSVASKAFGYSRDDVENRLLLECSLTWDTARIGNAILECTAQGTTVRVDDIAYSRPDGSHGILGVNVSPLGVGQATLGCLLHGSDITDRRVLESQLAHAQKMESIGQLAAGIAHEINTPIQYISDNTRFVQESTTQLTELLIEYDALTQRAMSIDTVREQAQSIVDLAEKLDIDYLQAEVPLALEQSLEGLQRVAHIVRSMKDFSHPGGEGKSYEDVNRAIERAVTVARNEWKYVADLITDLDPDLPCVPCCPTELDQVILNLTINAAHAIEDGRDKEHSGKGLITIRTRRVGQWVRIQITDTGCGIPESIQPKIFDPFFTTKEVGRGTGQGLAIARAVIVEKHQGTIEVASEVGYCTTFTICLPLEAFDTANDHAPKSILLAA